MYVSQECGVFLSPSNKLSILMYASCFPFHMGDNGLTKGEVLLPLFSPLESNKGALTRNNFLVLFSPKQLLQVARTVFTCNTPFVQLSFFYKFHEKLNNFLLSAANFFKFRNEDMCNMAPETGFVTL